MLIPLRHLIIRLLFPGVRVSLTCTVDYSLHLILALFWLRFFFPFIWLNPVILNADCSLHLVWPHWIGRPIFEVDMGFRVGETGQQRMLSPLQHLILPLHLSGGVSVALHSILYLPFGLQFTFYTFLALLFCIWIDNVYFIFLFTANFVSVFSSKFRNT
jgi:hypothetical protein